MTYKDAILRFTSVAIFERLMEDGWAAVGTLVNQTAGLPRDLADDKFMERECMTGPKYYICVRLLQYGRK